MKKFQYFEYICIGSEEIFHYEAKEYFGNKDVHIIEGEYDISNEDVLKKLDRSYIFSHNGKIYNNVNSLLRFLRLSKIKYTQLTVEDRK